MLKAGEKLPLNIGKEVGEEKEREREEKKKNIFYNACQTLYILYNTLT
jgi:hypothetical protein